MHAHNRNGLFMFAHIDKMFFSPIHAQNMRSIDSIRAFDKKNLVVVDFYMRRMRWWRRRREFDVEEEYAGGECRMWIEKMSLSTFPNVNIDFSKLLLAREWKKHFLRVFDLLQLVRVCVRLMGS